MTNLLNELTNATQELKAAYLKEIENFSKRSFERANKEKDMRREELEDQFESNPILRRSKALTKKQQAGEIVFYGLNVLVEKNVKAAINHFENSLVKLEARILKKGLNLESLTLESGYIDNNFNCLITDNNGKKVKAQTILAWGMIQKPHYRYLVK